MITFIVTSLTVMVIHCCIWFKQKKSVVSIIPWQGLATFVHTEALVSEDGCEGLFFFGGGGKSILKHLYLNYYADFDSKISYIMFLHDYQLACEISNVTIRTLALYEWKYIN